MEHVDINAFVSREIKSVSKEERNRIKREYTQVDYNEKDENGKLKYNNSKYNWEMIATAGFDQKYGREMVSHRYKIRRGLTMGEFYMNSTVD